MRRGALPDARAWTREIILWLAAMTCCAAPSLAQVKAMESIKAASDVPADAAASRAGTQAVPGYRFARKVVVPSDDAMEFVWYAFDAKTGASILAPDGQPEPFAMFRLFDKAVGLFSSRRIVATGPKPNRNQVANVLGSARLEGSEQAVRMQYCCPEFRYSISLRAYFPESDWQAIEAMREAMQLFSLEERGESSSFSGCAGIEYPAGLLGRSNPVLGLRWRIVYVVDEYREMTSCTGFLNFDSGGDIGDPLGDGTRLVALQHGEGRKTIVFRVDERTGRPIGRLPDWLRVLSVDEVVAFRNAFRARHQCPPMSEADIKYFGGERKVCWVLVDLYQQALLEHFFGRKKPRRL